MIGYLQDSCALSSQERPAAHLSYASEKQILDIVGYPGEEEGDST
jgi:hypothetical protein